ncbi:hypothetical protein [Plantactinospora sp. GCM10030261]|uniref:hypothetical protein n=1 Tax=Plantactinospora sp. GCM10030261 TaxID=3273420 RepID=UPI0036244B43
MSTFMGMAWIDLCPDVAADAGLAAFDAVVERVRRSPYLDLFDAGAGSHELADGRCRIQSFAERDYAELATAVVSFAAETGMVFRAFVALDHDEFGAEHVVLDAAAGEVRRAYHYFAFPRDEETGEYYTEGGPGVLAEVPVIEKPTVVIDPGVLADGPVARATVAARYGVPVSAMHAAAAADASAHLECGAVGGPSSHWQETLGLAWDAE